MSEYQPTFRVWQQIQNGGKQIDENFAQLAIWLNTMNIGSLAIYANNAAALAGGLVAGQFYRTGADPDYVCVVH